MRTLSTTIIAVAFCLISQFALAQECTDMQFGPNGSPARLAKTVGMNLKDLIKDNDWLIARKRQKISGKEYYLVQPDETAKVCRKAVSVTPAQEEKKPVYEATPSSPTITSGVSGRSVKEVPPAASTIEHDLQEQIDTLRDSLQELVAGQVHLEDALQKEWQTREQLERQLVQEQRHSRQLEQQPSSLKNQQGLFTSMGSAWALLVGLVALGLSQEKVRKFGKTIRVPRFYWFHPAEGIRQVYYKRKTKREIKEARQMVELVAGFEFTDRSDSP